MNIKDRFLKYVMVPTMSNPESETTPSSSKQLVLAKMIYEELKEMGLSDVRISEYGYVYAKLPSNTDKKVDKIGFIAHMDTSSEASDENIKPRVVEYKGGDILLNEEKNILMKVKDYPYLDKYIGQRLIVTDGTTLLGADDKAGVSEIITAIELIKNSNIEHGDIMIGITPDEEVGRGANYFDVEGFGCKYAYTVDGGALGEIEYENFNAGGATVVVNGVSIHPGSAKDKMKNAITIGYEFNSLLPQDQTPEHTEGYEGFFHLHTMKGVCEKSVLNYIVRDHSKEKFEEKMALLQTVTDKLNEKYGEGTIELSTRYSYKNMKEMIEPNMYIIDRAKAAMKDLGVEPIIVPIRGGTDGARLSFMGLPCPNLCTGGENFHSRFEFASLDAMEKIVSIIVKIIENLPNQCN